MATKVADIAIEIGADIGPLMRATARAGEAVTKFGKLAGGLGNQMQNLGGKATQLGKSMSIFTAAVVGAGAAALALTKSAADNGEAIANSSKAAGMATGYYQEMAYAMSEAADMSGEEFAGAMVKLNKTIGEAASGSQPAIDALTALGISTEEIAAGGVTSQEALDALIVKLDGVKDPAEAAKVAADLLGKSGARMGTLLVGAAGQVNDLRTAARDLGIIIPPEAIAASDEFNEKWAQVAKQFEAVKIAAATVLMPFFVNDLIPFIQGTVLPALGSLINSISGWVEAFHGLPEPAREAILAVSGLFVVGGPLLVAIGTAASVIGSIVAATGPIGLLIGAAALLVGAWSIWGDDFKRIVGDAIGWVTEKFDGFMAVLDGIIAKLKSWKDAAKEFISIDDGSGLREDNGGGFNPMGDFNGGGGTDIAPGGAGNDMLGADVANGLANGFVTQLATRQADILAGVDLMTQGVRDRLGVQSPSTVFQEIGQFLGIGMANGINASQGLVAQAAATMGDAAVGASKVTAAGILDVMSGLFEGSKAISAAQALVNVWTGATEALKLPFPSSLLAFGKVLGTGLAAVKNIQGARVGGGSGGGASAAAAAPAPMQFSLTAIGDGRYVDQSQLWTQLKTMNDLAGDKGFTLLTPLA